MSDKNLMDNRTVNNPLLSNVNQSSFFQEYVQSPLLVPAAPNNPLQQSTVDTVDIRAERSLEKQVLKVASKAEPVALCSGPIGEQKQHLLLTSNQSQPLSSSVIKESTSGPGLSLNPSRSPRPEAVTAGPPPLINYSRPTGRLPSSRYPSTSFLQTVPSAQFPPSQANLVSAAPLSTNSVQSIPKSSSSSPLTYFIPQQEVLEPGNPLPTSRSFNDNLTSIGPQPSLLQPSYSTAGLTASPVQATHSSVLTPCNVVQPLTSPYSIQPAVGRNQPDSGTIVPSLPISQPTIVSTSNVGVPHVQAPSVSPSLLPTSLSSSTRTNFTNQTPIISSSPFRPVTSVQKPSGQYSTSPVPTCAGLGPPKLESSTTAYSQASPILKTVTPTLNTQVALDSSVSTTNCFNSPSVSSPSQPIIPVSSTPREVNIQHQLSDIPAVPIQPTGLNQPAVPIQPTGLNQPAVPVQPSGLNQPAVPIQPTGLNQPAIPTHQAVSSPSINQTLPNTTFQPIPSSSPLSEARSHSSSSPVSITSTDLRASSLGVHTDHRPSATSPGAYSNNQKLLPSPPSHTVPSSGPIQRLQRSGQSENKSPPPILTAQTRTTSTSVTNPPQATSLPSVKTVQHSLFTFSTPPISSSFAPQPYSSASTLSQLPALNKPVLSSSSSEPLPIPPPLPKQDVTSASVPYKSPPLLDPAKFFSSSPSTNQFIGPPNLEQVPNPTQLYNTVGFTPFPSRQFSNNQNKTPVTGPLVQPSPFPSNSDISGKTSILSSPPTSTGLSYTPPPPYSSLDFTPTNSSNVDGSTATTVQNTSDDEELDQIPLEENAVPLYNPQSLQTKLHQKAPISVKGGNSNTYRLGSGLKRPSYAPVPDLGVTHQASPVLPTMSSSSTHPSTSEPTAPPTTGIISPPLTPSSSVTGSPPPESYNFSLTTQGQVYRPAYHHWFYKKPGESKSIWQPFSMADSLNLEQVFTSPDLTEKTKVATDGGRYDVEVVRRRKVAVYWEEPPSEVRRCSWFVRAPLESRYIPYDENIAEILEDSYKAGCLKNEWNRRVELADGEVIILYSPNAMAHHQRSSSPDAWGNPPAMQQKPRIVKRGVDDIEFSEGEPNQVDHLLLMVHGIGKVCDFRFRSLVQVVDDFRSVSLQLVQSHFRTGIQNGNVGRVEVLPVEWHRALHTEIIDKRLSDITLPSIPRAREFTNDVLLDILFYTSPVFCEKIVQAVGAEINRVYDLYMSRNPGFSGGVSLGGHSLGSLILFDMLSHQRPPHRILKSTYSPQSSIQECDEDMPEFGCYKAKARLSRRMSYLTIGTSGTGQPYINYPQLNFEASAFFAIGSPIGMFLTVRGIESLGEEFKFPTCPKFFNIFHPNDPVAYRIEALVSSEMVGVPAVVIPHHKGRKRMHLELKDTMTHVTAALKQKLIDSMRSTWNTVYQLAMFHRPESSIQQEVDKVIENEILNSDCDTASSNEVVMTEEEALNMKVGCLNGGQRIDYVLQEAPLETFNQYISAVRSHVVYWESEDTMLLILKELYATRGILPDSQGSQTKSPFDISSDTLNDNYSEYTDSIGARPTYYIRK